MTTKKRPHSPLSLEVKALVAAITVEPFHFRENVHVNVVTTATDPSICVFIYVNGRCEKSITIFLTDADAVDQLEAAYNTVRSFKKQGALPQSNLKLAG